MRYKKVETGQELEMTREIIIPAYEVERISDGLGFGEGTISTQDRLADDGDPLTPEIIDTVEHIITNGQILQEAGSGDGCGDGREAVEIFGNAFEKRLAKIRAKIFGGGSAMTAASLIGSGQAEGLSIKELFSRGIKLLRRANLTFGAHTDNKAQGVNSGCGAIDKAPSILANTEQYREQVSSVLQLLTGGVDTETVDNILDNFSKYSHQVSAEEHSGREIISEILDNDYVVKELDSDHRETHIIINTLDGYTVNQDLFRKQTDQVAQVFVIDEWRLKQISEALTDNPDESKTAYLSMLVYTLSTAGTLTKGDLPVYLLKAKTQ